MIGVIAKPHQISTVEEFFELFKTPWEFYRDGSRYDVLLTTAQVPPVDASLVIAFGSEPKELDALYALSSAPAADGVLVHRDFRIPVYGDLRAFRIADATDESTSRPSSVLHLPSAAPQVIRCGYDLFDEVRSLLLRGQPVANAHVPTLDLHIAMLREWIVGSGVGLMEILPAPAGHDFAVCLTHDIDFIGIRKHFFDHSMFGFLYRSTVGALRDLWRRRLTIRRLLRMWRAAMTLPFVYLGWAEDFWEPFRWYLRVERALPATYYLIPFKHRQGDNVPGTQAKWRATTYDVGDLQDRLSELSQAACEIGVHGLDAWHSAESGRSERARLGVFADRPVAGIRMHWLLHSDDTPRILEEAGYEYDSTSGYNAAIGYLNGTTQVFRPLGVQRLLELPMHIQDGALFFPDRLDLSEEEAWSRCSDLIRQAREFGGVLTVLWHDRSHGPERFWGEFYVRLVETLRSSAVWFATASDVVSWFRTRRSVRFETRADGAILVSADSKGVQPSLNIRLHRPGTHDLGMPGGDARVVDIAWDAKSPLAVEAMGTTPLKGRMPVASECWPS